MGRGDRKTRKGKIAIRSSGNARPHAPKKAATGTKPAAAIDPLTRAKDIRSDLLLPESPKLAETLAVRAECLAALGRTDEAVADATAASEIGNRNAELAKSYRTSIERAENAVRQPPIRVEARAR
jgi:ribosomal small subunit protein bTHX